MVVLEKRCVSTRILFSDKHVIPARASSGWNPGVWCLSGDTAPCKVTSAILHGVASPEFGRVRVVCPSCLMLSGPSASLATACSLKWKHLISRFLRMAESDCCVRAVVSFLVPPHRSYQHVLSRRRGIPFAEIGRCRPPTHRYFYIYIYIYIYICNIYMYIYM